MKLMVVESPNKIKKLESILGSDWKVMASVGHIRDLPRNDLGIEQPGFTLNYEFIPPATVQGRTFPGGEERVARIRKEARNAEMVYLASDPDREGEAIAWHLKETLGLDESEYMRVTFDAITPDVIKAALNKARKIDYDLVHAQEARRALDRMYGYLVSPLLSDMLGMSLSAGRVQSPAVRLVVDQERRIKAFKKTSHFGAVVAFDGESWQAEWNTKPFVSEDKPYVLDEALANRAAACRQFRVTDADSGPAKQSPPSPFSTSLLLQLAREQEALGIKAEGKRIDVENLSEKALEQDDANDIAERTGGTTDRDSQQFTEREKNRQVELMEQVHSQFRVAGAKFYFKDQPGKLAMKDKGERMVSASNDDRVAKAMATMAEAKGWKTIKVSGHPDFQREVWMEASLRGIEARGYKPTEQDLKLLEDKRERAMHNTVERDQTARERKPEQQRQDAGRKTDSARQERPVAADKAEGKGLAGQAVETAAKVALRAYAGRVLEHGAANFNHDPKEKPNYFVKLATDQGEKTVWGVDLKRAMSEGKVKAGDDVKLEYRGNTPVTVEALKRDKAGNVIGKEEITTNRNQWDVQKSDKAKVAEAVASAFIDSKVKDPAQREALKAAVGARMAEREKANKVPAVPVYDKAAPAKSQQPERTGPVVERNAERTR